MQQASRLPVVVPFVSFSSGAEFSGAKLQETFVQFPCSPVEPLDCLSASLGLRGPGGVRPYF